MAGRHPMNDPWLDLRAQKIADPVERLRFLRREMQALEKEAPTARPKLRPWGWAMATGVALVTILAAARPTHVDATAHLAPAIATGQPRVQNETGAIGASTYAPSRVWRIERTNTFETYSNGLRVDLTFAAPNKPRGRYPVFPPAGGSDPLRYQDAPAGIVYHTTESNLADFDETQNQRLKWLGRNLLEIVREERAYHYVIDRFGRVFQVVEETDIANHSGHSIWADSTGVYVNLNDSFLAVAFEAQTGDPNSVTAAQVQAARMLTEMLRFKYSIPAGNCVTHGQVSVSGVNTHIGAHTDWGSQFPFAAVGLPDNYAEPLPSLTVFGFEYDSAFVQAAGRWRGLDRADDEVAGAAADAGVSLTRYRAMLQHRYSDALGVVTASEEQVSEGGN